MRDTSEWPEIIYLTKDARPQLTTTKEIFLNQCEDGIYWGLPVEYFDIEHRTVYLSSDIAHLLEWNLDAVEDDFINVNTYAQNVTLDNKSYSLNPGSFCSDVKKENVLNI